MVRVPLGVTHPIPPDRLDPLQADRRNSKKSSIRHACHTRISKQLLEFVQTSVDAGADGTDGDALALGELLIRAAVESILDGSAVAGGELAHAAREQLLFLDAAEC